MGEDGFVFHYLPETKYQSFGNPSVQPLLNKWGFGQDMVILTFRVEQNVGPDGMQAMLRAFFCDRLVLGVLHSNTSLRVTNAEKVCVTWERLDTKAVNMSFLDKFEAAGAVGSAGHIRGRVEEHWEGVPITDLVREVILMEESEMYDAFSEQERKEFLFHIFSHLVFGGASNQYEDHVEEYFRVTKQVYKDLLSVRQRTTGDVEVVSVVAAVQSLGQGGNLFSKDSPLNFCYVILDPLVRHIHVWYFGYKPLW